MFDTLWTWKCTRLLKIVRNENVRHLEVGVKKISRGGESDCSSKSLDDRVDDCMPTQNRSPTYFKSFLFFVPLFRHSSVCSKNLMKICVKLINPIPAGKLSVWTQTGASYHRSMSSVSDLSDCVSVSITEELLRRVFQVISSIWRLV